MSAMHTQQRARRILDLLKKIYTRKPGDFVAWKTPLQLVAGTILSAQCTDKRVNMVTKTLFKKYKTPHDFARARLPVLEKEIRSTGFYRSKARYLKGAGEMLVREFDGRVPKTVEELKRLPGVSNKTAHLIMAKLHGIHSGVAVDTHVKRLAYRMGLTRHTNPVKIEHDLNVLFPAKDYLEVNEFMILHGRAVCTARSPKCGACPVAQWCPKVGVVKK